LTIDADLKAVADDRERWIEKVAQLEHRVRQLERAIGWYRTQCADMLAEADELIGQEYPSCPPSRRPKS